MNNSLEALMFVGAGLYGNDTVENGRGMGTLKKESKTNVPDTFNSPDR